MFSFLHLVGIDNNLVQAGSLGAISCGLLVWALQPGFQFVIAKSD